MAILIEKQVPKLLVCGVGEVKASYWKIVEIYGNLLENISTIKLNGYISAEARQGGLQPVDTKQVSFSAADHLFDITVNDQLSMNPIKLAYEKIKTLPEFQGALDV